MAQLAKEFSWLSKNKQVEAYLLDEMLSTLDSNFSYLSAGLKVAKWGD